MPFLSAYSVALQRKSLFRKKKKKGIKHTKALTLIAFIRKKKEEGDTNAEEEELIPVLKPRENLTTQVAGIVHFSYSLILYSIFKKSEEVSSASKAVVEACGSGDVHEVIRVLNNTNMYFLIASLRKFSSKFTKMLKRPKTSRRYRNLLGFSPLISRWVRASKLAECPRMQEAFYAGLFDDKDNYVADYLDLLITAILEKDEHWVHHVHATAVVLRHITARLGRTFLDAKENAGVLDRVERSAAVFLDELCSEGTLSTPGGPETALWCLGYTYPYIVPLVSAADFASAVVDVVHKAREDRLLRPMLARFIGSIYGSVNNKNTNSDENTGIQEKTGGGGGDNDGGEEVDVQNFLMGTFIETITQHFAAGGSRDDVKAVEIAGAQMLLSTPRIVSDERREEELMGLMTLAVTVATKCDVHDCACAYGLLNFFYAAQQCPSALCIGATYFVKSLKETSFFLSCIAYIWTLLLENLLRDPSQTPQYNSNTSYSKRRCSSSSSGRLSRSVAAAIVKVLRCLVDVFVKGQGASWHGEKDLPHGSLLYLLLSIICPEQLPPTPSSFIPFSPLAQQQQQQQQQKKRSSSTSAATATPTLTATPSTSCPLSMSSTQSDYEGDTVNYDDDDNDDYEEDNNNNSNDSRKPAQTKGGTASEQLKFLRSMSSSALTPSPSPSISLSTSRRKKDKKDKEKEKEKKKNKIKGKKKKQAELLDRTTLAQAVSICKDICKSMTDAGATIDPSLAEVLYSGFFTLIVSELREKKKRAKRFQRRAQRRDASLSTATKEEEEEDEDTTAAASNASLDGDAGECAAAIALCEWRGPKRNLSALFAGSYSWMAPFVFRGRARSGLCGSSGIAAVAVFNDSLKAVAEACNLPEAEVDALARLGAMLSRHVKSFADDLHIATEGGGGSRAPRAAWERVLIAFLRRGADPRTQRALGLAALHSLCMCAAEKGGNSIACSDAYLCRTQYTLSWELSAQTLEAFPYISARSAERHPLKQALAAFAGVGDMDAGTTVARRMLLDGLVTLSEYDKLLQFLSSQHTSGVPRIHYAVVLDGYKFPPALDGAAFVACVMPHISFDMFAAYLKACFGNDTVVTPASAPFSTASYVLKPPRRATVYRAWSNAEVQYWKTLRLSGLSSLVTSPLLSPSTPFCATTKSLFSKTGLGNDVDDASGAGSSSDPFLRSALPVTEFVAFVHDLTPRPREWTQEYEINDGSHMVTEFIPSEITHSTDLPSHRDRALVLRFQTATELPGLTSLSPAVLSTTTTTSGNDSTSDTRPQLAKERCCLVETCTQWATAKCADLRKLFSMLTFTAPGPNPKRVRASSLDTLNDSNSANDSNEEEEEEEEEEDDNYDNSENNRGKRILCCSVCKRRFNDTNSESGRNSDTHRHNPSGSTRRATIIGSPSVLSRSSSLSSITPRKRSGTSEDIPPKPSSPQQLSLSPPSLLHHQQQQQQQQQIIGQQQSSLASQKQSWNGYNNENENSSAAESQAPPLPPPPLQPPPIQLSSLHRYHHQHQRSQPQLVKYISGNNEECEGECCVDLSDPICGHDILLGIVEDVLLKCGGVGIDTCMDLLAVEDARVEAIGDMVEAYSRKNYLRKAKADPSTPRPDFSSIRVCRVAEYGTLREATGKLLGMVSTAMLNLTRLYLLVMNSGCGGWDSSTAEFNYGHHMELEEKLFNLRWKFTQLKSIATATATTYTPMSPNSLNSPILSTHQTPDSQQQQQQQKMAPPPPQLRQQQQATPLTTISTTDPPNK